MRRPRRPQLMANRRMCAGACAACLGRTVRAGDSLLHPRAARTRIHTLELPSRGRWGATRRERPCGGEGRDTLRCVPSRRRAAALPSPSWEATGTLARSEPAQLRPAKSPPPCALSSRRPPGTPESPRLPTCPPSGDPASARAFASPGALRRSLPRNARRFFAPLARALRSAAGPHNLRRVGRGPAPSAPHVTHHRQPTTTASRDARPPMFAPRPERWHEKDVRAKSL